MRLIATTVVRQSIKGKQQTGHIYDVEWDEKAVRHRLPVPDPMFPESDDNPRGGVRGGRGVAVTRKGILVANYDTLLRYDDDWELLDSFSHPLFVGMHEVDWDGEALWTTCTAIDAVVKTRLDGDAEIAWDPHGPGFAGRLGLRGRRHPIDGTLDYRQREAPLVDDCHINCVSHHAGAMVINCGLVRKKDSLQSRALDRVGRRLRGDKSEQRNAGLAAVVRINGAAADEILVRLDNIDFPAHNGQLLNDDHVVVNDSTRNTLRVFETHEGAEVKRLTVPGTWLRGLEPVSPTQVFVGTAPASIVLVDLDRMVVEDQLKLSDDPNEAIHGLTLVPRAGERR